MKKKKAVRAHINTKHAVRHAGHHAKHRGWSLKRILMTLGFAALALMVSAEVPHTQRFVPKVLGDSDNLTEAQKQQVEQQKEAEKRQEEAAKQVQEQQQQRSGSPSRETQIETKTGDTLKTKIEDNGAVKIEGKKRDVQYKFEAENGVVQLKAENAEGKELKTREHALEKKELEESLDDEEIEISTEDGHLAIEHNFIRAEVKFPLSMDPITHQLIVTTPAGERTVAVLPDAAMQKLLDSGLLSTVASNSATPGAASGSATLGAGSVELKMDDGKLVYEVQGEKVEKFLGIIPVALPKTVTVSALTGETLSQTQSWFTTMLGWLSF